MTSNYPSDRDTQHHNDRPCHEQPRDTQLPDHQPQAGQSQNEQMPDDQPVIEYIEESVFNLEAFLEESGYLNTGIHELQRLAGRQIGLRAVHDGRMYEGAIVTATEPGEFDQSEWICLEDVCVSSLDTPHIVCFKTSCRLPRRELQEIGALTVTLLPRR